MVDPRLRSTELWWSMFERENLSGSNYNDWFRSPKMVLRVEKKPFVIEQPTFRAPHANSKYLRSGMRFMMLIMRLLVLCSEKEGKPVGLYVIKMKNYVAQLERLGYVLPRDLSAATPQVMAIQGGRIQKANKKSLNAKGKGKGKGKGKDKIISLSLKTLNLMLKEHPTKDDTCHHYKEAGHCKMNCPAYLAELIKKKKQVGTATSSDIFRSKKAETSRSYWK
ncbi:hypothetical protein Tco_1014217 [Tanacetum coccineum]